MRKRFEIEMQLGVIPIEEVNLNFKCRDALPKILTCLQAIYKNREIREQVFTLLEQRINKTASKLGRSGMKLWEMFVLSMVRTGLNISYDRLHDYANNHKAMRGILGVEPSDFTIGKQYEYQNIWDNSQLIDEDLLQQINSILVEFGHGVFKKKEGEALRIKSDCFVVESNVHFPTDYNLLWDSARKCLSVFEKILQEHPEITGWRKINNWHNELKNLMLEVGKKSVAGGKNKTDNLKSAVDNYLKKSSLLSKKITVQLTELPLETDKDLFHVLELEWYKSMLDKHIDLLDRRILKDETIPHSEKIFSIFETYTNWITKGKKRPSVELGKNLMVATDQFNLIVGWQLLETETEQDAHLTMVEKLLANNYKLDSYSTDKGGWNKENVELLRLFVRKVVIPKKGKRNTAQREEEQSTEFKKLKNAHSAIESNINELENRALGRCPDKGYNHFKRYCGLGICSYNIHKIGAEIIRQEKEKQKKIKKRGYSCSQKAA